MIAKVYVDVEHIAVDTAFDYQVPEALRDALEVGQRVMIPFTTRKITGIVSEIKETSEIEKLKSIIDIIDPIPLFSQELLNLAETLAFEHVTPRTRYLNAMLPNALRMQYQKHLEVLDKENLPDTLKPLFESNETIRLDKSLNQHLSTIKKAIENNQLKLNMQAKQAQQTIKIPVVKLETYTKVQGQKQQAIIDYLKDRDAVERKTLLEATNASPSTLRTLVDKKIVNLLSKETYREIKSMIEIKDKKVTLNPEQSVAYEAIKTSLNTSQTFLLHGVTSSGKTEIYLNIVEAVIKEGKSAIVMVPEISLTPLLTARFKARFKALVAVYHSRLSTGERFDEWRRIKEGKAKILIGARSSIFAPMENIGVIILDEEHSDSYRQEDNPKYDARKLALQRANHHQAPVVLGSATPSIESYYKACHGHYQLLELKHRAEASQMPKVTLIDMRQEFIKGNTSVFSSSLKNAMETRLKNQEQTLLLINRRGHANFILCRSCGHTINCDDCDVSMTYHKQSNQLKCHYCNAVKPMPTTCPKCHSKHIRYMGLGSERVELLLKDLFPQAKVYRMDKDTTQTKEGHAKVLNAFEADGDFLVGTQMISKGLDFDRVTLVGILSADMALFVPDYYAKEETFAMLTQMAGRSGRRQKQGQVIIQAYQSDHPVLKDVQQHDYHNFYHTEIALREKADIPPFKEMIAMTISHHIKNIVFKTTTQMIQELKQKLSKEVRIIGPITPKYERIKGRYRMYVLMKTTTMKTVLETLNPIVENHIEKDLTIDIDHHPTMF